MELSNNWPNNSASKTHITCSRAKTVRATAVQQLAAECNRRKIKSIISAQQDITATSSSDHSETSNANFYVSLVSLGSDGNETVYQQQATTTTFCCWLCQRQLTSNSYIELTISQRQRLTTRDNSNSCCHKTTNYSTTTGEANFGNSSTCTGGWSHYYNGWKGAKAELPIDNDDVDDNYRASLNKTISRAEQSNEASSQLLREDSKKTHATLVSSTYPNHHTSNNEQVRNPKLEPLINQLCEQSFQTVKSLNCPTEQPRKRSRQLCKFNEANTSVDKISKATSRSNFVTTTTITTATSAQLKRRQNSHHLFGLSHLVASLFLFLLFSSVDYRRFSLIDNCNSSSNSGSCAIIHSLTESSKTVIGVDASALYFEVSHQVPRVNSISDTILQHNKSLKEIKEILANRQYSNLAPTTLGPQIETNDNSGQLNLPETTVPVISIETKDYNDFSATTVSTTTTSDTILEREPVETTSNGQYNGSGSVNDDNDVASGSSISDDEPTKAKNITDNEKLVELQSDLQKQMRKHVKDIIRATYDMGQEMPLSGQCLASSLKMLSGLQELRSWAFKFVDASSKLPNGFMSGMLSDLGDFDQCLSIRTNKDVSPSEEADSSDFSEGIDEDGLLWEPLLRKYWTSKSNKGFQVGVCLPSKCSNEDIDIIYNHTTRDTDIMGGILSCQDSLDVKRNQTADFLQKTIMGLFLILLITVFLGTLINIMCPIIETKLFYPSNNEDWSLVINLARFYVAFSLIRNWKIFTQSGSSAWIQYGLNDNKNNTSNVPETTQSQRIRLIMKINSEKHQHNKIIGHLSGIKLLVIGWIMMGHSFLYPSASNYQYFRAMAHMASIRDSIWFATTNFTLGIDTLLYMAGFLFVHKAMTMNSNSDSVNNSNSNKISDKSHQLAVGLKNVAKIICHKILRFWPTYLTIVGLAILCPLFGEGPLWPETVDKRLGQACRNNWWSNLLFINNYQDEQEICLPSSWFLSILMQALLVGSIVILVAQIFSISKALISLSVLIVGTIVASFCHAYLIDIDAPVVRMDESFVMNIDGNIFTLYTRLYNNLGPFLIGMAGGFLLILSSSSRQQKQKSHNDDSLSSTASSRHYSTPVYDRPLFKLLLTLVMTSLALLALSTVFITNYTRLQSALYWSLNRICWSMATGHLIHRCATDEWSLLRRLLSLSTLRPISKLIFISYLVYPIYIHIHTGLVRDGLHISPYNMINIYITRLVFTFGTALMIHLFVEIPFCTLEENFLLKSLLCSSTIDQDYHRNSDDNDEDPSKSHPLLRAHRLYASKADKERKESTAEQSITSSGVISIESSVDYTSNDSDELSQLRVNVTN